MASLDKSVTHFQSFGAPASTDAGSKWDLVTPITKDSLRHPGLT